MLPQNTIKLAKDIEAYGLAIKDVNLAADFDRPRKLTVNGHTYTMYSALEDSYYRFFYNETGLVCVAIQSNFDDSPIQYFKADKHKVMRMLGELTVADVKARLAAGITLTLYDTVFIEDALATAECDRLLYQGV